MQNCISHIILFLTSIDSMDLSCATFVLTKSPSNIPIIILLPKVPFTNKSMCNQQLPLHYCKRLIAVIMSCLTIGSVLTILSLHPEKVKPSSQFPPRLYSNFFWYSKTYQILTISSQPFSFLTTKHTNLYSAHYVSNRQSVQKKGQVNGFLAGPK